MECHSREGGNPGIASTDLIIQVRPERVARVNQLELPRPLPMLNLLLPRDGRLSRVMHFIPDQLMDVVFFGKAGSQIVLVLVNALDQIGCDSRVESSVAI